VIWLQTPTAFWLGGGNTSISQLLNDNDVRQTEINTAEPLVSEPSAFEVDLATGKLKSHKSPDIDQTPAELIKAGSRTICSEIYKRIISICK
jgi:hypothetical protein